MAGATTSNVRAWPRARSAATVALVVVDASRPAMKLRRCTRRMALMASTLQRLLFGGICLHRSEGEAVALTRSTESVHSSEDSIARNAAGQIRLSDD